MKIEPTYLIGALICNLFIILLYVPVIVIKIQLYIIERKIKKYIKEAETKSK